VEEENLAAVGFYRTYEQHDQVMQVGLLKYCMTGWGCTSAFTPCRHSLITAYKMKIVVHSSY
jgi:hypothetical protein